MAAKPNESGLCMCGCGQTTRRAAETSRRDRTVAGEHLCYVHGHNNRKVVWQRKTGRDAGRWYLYDRTGSVVTWARVVAENMLGRELLPNEQVHHVNEDRSDDRLENLEVLTVAAHARIHAERRGFGTRIRGIRGRVGYVAKSA